MAKRRKKSAKHERCIQSVKRKGTGNPFAICQAAMNKSRRRRRRNK